MPRDVYAGIQYRCQKRSSSWYPAQKTGWNSVVATWQIPPATLGTVFGPLSPEVMPKPHWNPASIVVGPTSLLNENVWPGATTTPFRRCAASWVLCFFSGIEPANDVLPRSI